MSHHTGKSKNTSQGGQKKKEGKLKYPIFTILILLGTGLIFINTNQGRGLLSALTDNESTGRQETTPVTVNTQKEEAAPAVAADKPAELNTQAESQVKPPQPATVKIALSQLNSTGKFFTYKSKNNVTIKYFALLDAQGAPHVAFDACDVCYKAKRGYAVQGDRAVCKNCGNAYPVQALGTENLRGGCWPSYLPIKIENKEIIINGADLEQKAYLFS